MQAGWLSRWEELILLIVHVVIVIVLVASSFYCMCLFVGILDSYFSLTMGEIQRITQCTKSLEIVAMQKTKHDVKM